MFPQKLFCPLAHRSPAVGKLPLDEPDDAVPIPDAIEKPVESIDGVPDGDVAAFGCPVLGSTFQDGQIDARRKLRRAVHALRRRV
jgi:hypothetical protein